MKTSKVKWFLAATVTRVLIGLVSIQLAHAQAPSQTIPFWNDSEVDSAMIVNHTPWQGLLNKYLDDQHPTGINRFAYQRVTVADKLVLRRYLEYLQSLEPRQLNNLEQKAYWINIYNSMTVLLILNEGGSNLRSIRQLRSGFFTAGPWQRKILTVAQQNLSLDDIEHGILRPNWQDNRIHYAVNCASLGCPNLLKTAFTGDNVEMLLEQAASEFVNHPKAVFINNGRLQLSKIYDWYSEDFGENFSALLGHLRKYAKPELATQLTEYTRAEYIYDWALNRP